LGSVLGLIPAVAPTPAALAADNDSNRGVLILPDAPPGPQPVPPLERPDQKVLAAENAAGLSLDVLPDTELAIGSNIRFRVSAKRSGYLILVDVDANGKLNQIFPNSAALLMPEGVRESFNRLQPGKPVTVPDAGNTFGGFEFIVSEPRGVAMAVAILSSEPVQLMDLPDVPAPMVGRADALKYLTEVARTLRIVRSNASGRLAEPKLAFDAKFYVVK
jgi:hypothetical protein